MKDVDLAFLGPEFLTWTYFYITHEGSEVKLEELCPKHHTLTGKLKLVLGKKMLLVPPENDSRVQLSSPILENCGEVLQAISAGSQIMQLSLELVIHERVYSVAVNGRDGSLSEVKCREMFDSDDDKEMRLEEEEKSAGILEEENVFLRMSFLDEVEDILRGLFSRFLTRRLAQAYVAEDVYDMRQLVVSGLAQKVPVLKKRTTSHLAMGNEPAHA